MKKLTTPEVENIKVFLRYMKFPSLHLVRVFQSEAEIKRFANQNVYNSLQLAIVEYNLKNFNTIVDGILCNINNNDTLQLMLADHYFPVELYNFLQNSRLQDIIIERMERKRLIEIASNGNLKAFQVNGISKSTSIKKALSGAILHIINRINLLLKKANLQKMTRLSIDIYDMAMSTIKNKSKSTLPDALTVDRNIYKFSLSDGTLLIKRSTSAQLFNCLFTATVQNLKSKSKVVQDTFKSKFNISYSADPIYGEILRQNIILFLDTALNGFHLIF